ncbi:MAG: RsmF rRNA methyltransferase first C-terminal domain-containing protein [Christensenellaceae bacterium]
MNLPKAFLERMRSLPDYEAFLASYRLPACKAIRVNTLKIDVKTFLAQSPLAFGERVPWEETGFYTEEEKVGRFLAHTQGLFYSQEPSAMCAVPLLGIERGDKVLDLCSAPGGKGTQAAAKLGGSGLIVLNEKMPDRAKILSRNAERLGIANAVVLNHDPSELARRFPSYFDKVLVDAPCSGEGMFKKEEAAIPEWSEENVAMCAQRQRNILDHAAAMLKVGGTLVYSTCTFAEAEDELQIADFFSRHPEFELVEEEKLYPHRVRGEGHFAAKLVKRSGEKGSVPTERRFLAKREEAVWRKFEKTFLRRPMQRLYAFGSSVSALPEGCFALDGLKVLRAGIPLGEIVGERFEPSHALAMALSAEEFCNLAPIDEEQAKKYLHGETVTSEGENGWCVVTCGGFAIGIGKRVNGIVKNHLPKGLRTT